MSTRFQVAISWQGNQHLSDYMFSPNPPFDFVLSGDPNELLEAGKLLIPENVVRAQFEPSILELELILGELMKNAIRPIVILGTPSPRCDSELIRKLLPTEYHFVQVAKMLNIDLETVPISSFPFRYKLWTLIQQLMKEASQRQGATFVPVPSSTSTPEGYLQEKFWGPDITHANSEYGLVVHNQLREMFNDA